MVSAGTGGREGRGAPAGAEPCLSPSALLPAHLSPACNRARRGAGGVSRIPVPRAAREPGLAAAEHRGRGAGGAGGRRGSPAGAPGACHLLQR